MNPIPGYESAPAYTGEAMQLPPGLYVCIVKQVNLRKVNEKEQMVLFFTLQKESRRDFIRNSLKFVNRVIRMQNGEVYIGSLRMIKDCLSLKESSVPLRNPTTDIVGTGMKRGSSERNLGVYSAGKNF